MHRQTANAGVFSRGVRTFAHAMVVALLASAAEAAPTAEDKCEGGKNDTSGKYAACVAKAEKTRILTGDAMKYGIALSKCEEKFGLSWGKLESKAVDAGTVCPSTGDQATVQDFMDACTQSVALAMNGGPLPLNVIDCNADLTICDDDLSTCDTDLSTTNADLGNCESDLSACAATPIAQTVRTGQQSCFNAAGSTIPCAGTGHDGELQKGVPRNFTNNGDGTITDNATGLMWEVLTNDGSVHDWNNVYTWTNAFAGKLDTVNGAAFAGHSDWRVPNRFELETLLNLEEDPAVHAEFKTACPLNCTESSCSCTASSFYWSSTSYYPGLTNYAQRVSMAGGSVDYEPKSSTEYVRLVRGTAVSPYSVPLKTGQTTCYDGAGGTIPCAGTGQDGELQKGIARSFTDNGDGTITDHATGLMWEKLADDGSVHDRDDGYTWADAVSGKIATLNSGNFAGHNDWRLPNLMELETLRNMAMFFPSPMTYSAFNDSCTGGCTVTTCSCTFGADYWSSSTHQYDPIEAWIVDFFWGEVRRVHKADDAFVRAVRSGS